MITGGVEAAVTLLAVNGFAPCERYRCENDDPQKASRPFDKDVMVLSSGGLRYSYSGRIIICPEKRRAYLCGTCGYGCTSDAFHMAAPPPGHEGAARSMRIAIKDAGFKSRRYRLHQRSRHINAAK